MCSVAFLLASSFTALPWPEPSSSTTAITHALADIDILHDSEKLGSKCIESAWSVLRISIQPDNVIEDII